ncbi:MAG: hypothetical protein C3F07_19875 [Anaerolineales bacterium]|nr:MAG: hypothetical protein C3F07_19875 [Anaerolineales bacterium]
MLAQKFSRYEIQEELGKGGMATVYRAHDPLFEREVALKILKRDLIDDPHFRERFERETKIIAKLEHAAIVPVYDIGRDNDQMFFVMRYMAGGSLAERIQKRSLSLNEIAHILRRIAAALDYAHAKGVIHRDLKPGNILFDEDNNAYISDFGIAKITQTPSKLTSSGIIGTPTYMSPEQAQGETVDGRSDVYSLGVILFEMLSGRAPYEATTPLGMAFKHAVDPVPNILKINPNLPAGVDAVLKKVLAKNPDQRYESGTEFAEAFIMTLPDPLTPAPNLLVPLTPARLQRRAEALTMHPSTDVPKPQTLPRFWILAGLVVIVILAAVFWGQSGFASTGTASTPSPEPVTVTVAPATSTPLPPTATGTSTATSEPSPVPVAPGIGGAVRIALTANRDIYLMDMDGRNIRQLTNTNIPKFDLQWLPGDRELLYGEGKCVYRVDAETTNPTPEKIACFNGEFFEGFRISPDGKWVAISIERRLIVLPYDTQALAKASSAFELQNLENVCLDYTDVAVRGAQWSADGQKLAIVYQTIVGQRLGQVIRVLDVDLVRCSKFDPLILDEFPGKRFVPEGYETYPLIPSYAWDGDGRFLFNSFKRNGGYGELYLYDMPTASGRKINPVEGACCYRGATFSPDGTYILFAFQDIRKGADSETQLYYIPIDQIDAQAVFAPIRVPVRFFPDVRENILFALQMPAQ